MKKFEREMEESCSHFGEREEHVKKNEEEEEIRKTCDQSAAACSRVWDSAQAASRLISALLHKVCFLA